MGIKKLNTSSHSNPLRLWPWADLKFTSSYHTPTGGDKLTRLLTWTSHRGTRNPRKNQKYVTHVKAQERSVSAGASLCLVKNWCGKGLAEKVCVLTSPLWENMVLRGLGHWQDVTLEMPGLLVVNELPAGTGNSSEKAGHQFHMWGTEQRMSDLVPCPLCFHIKLPPNHKQQ